jgi:hypothetical protein
LVDEFESAKSWATDAKRPLTMEEAGFIASCGGSESKDITGRGL